MDHDRRNGHVMGYQPSSAGHWHEAAGYNSNQTSPMQDYDSYPYPSLVHALPITSPSHMQSPIDHALSSSSSWPTKTSNGWPASRTQLSPAYQLPGPRSKTINGTSSSSNTYTKNRHAPSVPATTPRKTLSDATKREICMYAINNPNAKQTEIGDKFNVERSTISKVLRDKDKYMTPDEDTRPMKKRPAKYGSDVERTLRNFVRKWEKNGLVMLSDDDIIKEARTYCKAGPTDDTDFQPYDYNWLEAFKEKHNFVTMKNSSPSTSPNSAHSNHSPVDDVNESELQSELQSYKKPPLKRQRTPKRKRDLSRNGANGIFLPIPSTMTPPSTIVTNSPMASEYAAASIATSSYSDAAPHPATNHTHRRYTYGDYHPSTLRNPYATLETPVPSLTYPPAMSPNRSQPYLMLPPTAPHYGSVPPDFEFFSELHPSRVSSYAQDSPTVHQAEAALKTLQKYLRHTRSSLDMHEVETIRKLEAIRLRPSDPDLRQNSNMLEFPMPHHHLARLEPANMQ